MGSVERRRKCAARCRCGFVGTFLGIFIGYGFVGPLGAYSSQRQEDAKPTVRQIRAARVDERLLADRCSRVGRKVLSQPIGEFRELEDASGDQEPRLPP